MTVFLPIALFLYGAIGGWWACHWQGEIAHGYNSLRFAVWYAFVNVTFWPLSILYWKGPKGY